MREIKFRAWQIDQNTMIPFEKIEYLDLLDSQINIRITWDEDEAMEETLTLPLTDFELMQYTGLKDKNGKEVYEGDLLQDGKGVGEVKWVQEHCAFLVRTLNPHMYHYLESDERLTESEVIGNIYENPELLEDNPMKQITDV